MDILSAIKRGLILGRVYEGIIYYDSNQGGDPLWKKMMEENYPDAEWDLPNQRIVLTE